MRLFVSCLILVLLFGCSFQSAYPEKQDYNVTLADAVQNESFDGSKNMTINKISFSIQNNEDFAVDCDVVLKLDNDVNFSSSSGNIGILQPNIKKSVSLRFVMFSGNTSLSIIPKCKKY